MPIIVTISRPNTVGETYRKEADNYSDIEDFIERKCERLADKGWDIIEFPDSNSFNGIIEATHDNEADILVIEWTSYT